MGQTKVDVVVELARKQRMLRPRDLLTHRIPPDYLDRLHRRGVLTRVGRGLYVWPDTDWGEHQLIAEAAKRVPQGIICLLSALRFHELIEHSPPHVWIALSVKARHPRVEQPPLHIVRSSGASLTEGIENHVIEGVPVKVYGAAKTVADCFKFRSKIGVDVAVAALRTCVFQALATLEEIQEVSGICRMGNIIRPYLESMR